MLKVKLITHCEPRFSTEAQTYQLQALVLEMLSSIQAHLLGVNDSKTIHDRPPFLINFDRTYAPQALDMLISPNLV